MNLSDTGLSRALFKPGEIARIVSAQELGGKVYSDHPAYRLAIVLGQDHNIGGYVQKGDLPRTLKDDEYALIATTESVRVNYLSGVPNPNTRHELGIDIEPFHEHDRDSNKRVRVCCRVGFEFRAAEYNQNIAQTIHRIMRDEDTNRLSKRDFLSHLGHRFSDNIHHIVQTFLNSNSAIDLESFTGSRELNEYAKEKLAKRLGEEGLEYIDLLAHSSQDTEQPIRKHTEDRNTDSVAEHPTTNDVADRATVGTTVDRTSEIPTSDELRVVYSTEDSEKGEIYVIDPDEGRRKISIGRKPVWSPDGTHIAFLPKKQKGLCVVNTDGSNFKKLFSLASSIVLDTIWSPDGGHIAYVSYPDRGDYNWNIYTINSDGSNNQRITKFITQLPVIKRGFWSPDGSAISFVLSTRLGDDEESIRKFLSISVVNLSNSNVHQITPPPKHYSAHQTSTGPISWSPDSSHIAFPYRKKEGDAYNIYVANLNGSAPRMLVDLPGNQGFASWSPDGSRIAFSSNHEGHRNIYTINANGSDLRRVTSGSKDKYVESWSPYSNRIAFCVYPEDKDLRDGWSPDGNHTTLRTNVLYTIDVGGSGLRQVANSDSLSKISDLDIFWIR